MKKSFVCLFLIASSIVSNKLNAYCIHNKSNTRIFAYTFTEEYRGTMFESTKGRYTIDPGQKKCWNWTQTGAGSREKLWYFLLSKEHDFAQGWFPVGGAVAYWGRTKPANVSDLVTVHFGPDPDTMPEWNYREAPWHRPTRPWSITERYLP